MTVYFDKTNFFAFIAELDISPKGKDVLRFIKNQVNLHFNFKIDSLNEYERIIIEEFQEGVSANWKWTYDENKIKNRPVDNDSFPEKNGIYLIDDKNVDKVKLKHSFLIGKVNEEIETIEKLIIDIDDYGFHSQRIIGNNDFDEWEKIEQYCLPFSTILIVDRYMFKGPEIGGNLSFFDYNLGIILGKFFEKKQCKARLIFVYQINPFSDKTKPQYDNGPDVDKLKQRIKSAVKKWNKHCVAPEINLIGVPKGKINDEHDRHIITNYMRFKSGDTLVYFNSTGVKETKSNEFDIYSLGKKQYRNNTDLIIDKIKNFVIETNTKFPDRCILESNISVDSIFDF